MKLLVTGGAGYIGGVVTRTAAGRGPPGDRAGRPVDGPRRGGARRGELVDAPIADAAEVLTPDAGFDGVLHFAAKDRGRRVGGQARSNTGDTNVAAPARCSTRSRGPACRRLVFSSTAAVYGEPDRLPITERPPTGPPTLRRDQAGGRHDDHRRVRRARPGRRVAAVLQRRRGAPPAARSASGTTPRPTSSRSRWTSAAGRRGEAASSSATTTRPGRHLRAGLHPRRGPGPRPRAGARPLPSRASTGSTTWATATASRTARWSTWSAR